MSIGDSIADALTAVRNASRSKKEVVEIKASKLLERVFQILKDEGYIENFRRIEDKKQGILRVYLKYQEGKPAITQIKRISKPGRRIYADKSHIPRVLQGYGIAIISTSKGVFTDRHARKLGIGGEIVCEVY